MPPSNAFPHDSDLADLIPAYIAARRRDLEILRDHLDQADFETIAALGHQIRGSGGTYGFGKLSLLGKALEIAGQDNDTAATTVAIERLTRWLAKQP